MKYKVGDKVVYPYRGRITDFGTIIMIHPPTYFGDCLERYTIYWNWCGEKSAEGGFTAESLIPYYDPNDILKGIL